MSSRSYDRGYVLRPDVREERTYQSRRGRDAARRDMTTASERGLQYYYGSAAPDLNAPAGAPGRSRHAFGEETGRSHAASAGRRQKSRMNPLTIAGMAAALCALSVLLFFYIGLESKVTNVVEEISVLETQLSELRSDNDETLNEINAGISLDEIKYRAIAELGMSYAQEDQIIIYEGEESDYVRQVIQPD